MSNLTQANSDQQLIALWLHGKAQSTQSGYRAKIQRFLSYTAKPIAACTLSDLQGYLDSLTHLSPSTLALEVNVLKSLYSFAIEIGYVKFNPAKPLKPPAIKNTLVERILSEEDVRAIVGGEPDSTRRVMLRLLYGGALRASELCGLTWRDLQPRGKTGQANIFGKGGKTEAVLLPEAVWAELQQLPKRDLDDFVFPATRGGRLNRAQLWRIVKAAATRVGLVEASTHWFRHSHASHALERGATVALVQKTLRHSNVATTSKYLHVRPNESSGGFLAL